jgi:hypothetical protein
MLPSYFARNKAAMKTLTQSEKKTLLDLLVKISLGFAYRPQRPGSDARPPSRVRS